MLDGLPFAHAAVGTVGATTGTPISVPGIRSGQALLAVIKFNATSPTGLDPAAFTVSAGSIQSASLNTSGFNLRVENIGRRITRAGIEISKAVAPFAAVIAGGLAAAIKQSALVHGELAQAWERLSLQGRQLLRDIGNALTPAFVQLAQAKGGLI